MVSYPKFDHYYTSREPPAAPLHIGELDESARQEIVKHTLGKYNKVFLRFVFPITLCSQM